MSLVYIFSWPKMVDGGDDEDDDDGDVGDEKWWCWRTAVRYWRGRLRWVAADLNAGSKIVTESQAFLYPRYSHTWLQLVVTMIVTTMSHFELMILMNKTWAEDISQERTMNLDWIKNNSLSLWLVPVMLINPICPLLPRLLYKTVGGGPQNWFRWNLCCCEG